MNSEFDFYKLKKWVKIDRLHWWNLITKKDAIPFIEKHIDVLRNDIMTHKHNEKLSINPFAINILRKYPDIISWNDFVTNPNAIHVIEENIDVCFESLNAYGRVKLLSHPNFIHIIEKNTDKIIDKLLCKSCLPIVARKEEPIYMDLLEKYMKKNPDILPSPACDYIWDDIMKNPYAINIIKTYLHKLSLSCWQSLAENPNAIPILENNLDKLTQQGWNNLCENPNAIPLLKKNIDKINWFKFCNNKNAAEILEQYPDKIQCYSFVDYDNFSIYSSIFEIDYDAIEKRCYIYKEELMQVALHPSRIEKYLESGISVEELDNYI
jgi:hypothetical protein